MAAIDPDPESALPVLYSILDRYADAAEAGEQRIAEVVTGMIAELELERDEEDG